MKIRNLFILLCMVFLQASMSSCMGNNNKSAEKVSAVVSEDYFMQDDDSEEKTEIYFYNFVQEIIKKHSSKESDSLICTEFGNCNEVFTFILQQFNGNDKAKKQLAKNNRYESDYLTLEYADKNIKNGFARLKLTFKKRKEAPTNTIIFRSPTE